ncbi:hypothetical protein DICA0_D02850 [Diutina catenulata]
MKYGHELDGSANRLQSIQCNNIQDYIHFEFCNNNLMSIMLNKYTQLSTIWNGYLRLTTNYWMVTIFGLKRTGTWEPSISVVFGFCCLRISLPYFSVVFSLCLPAEYVAPYDAVPEASWLKQVLEHTILEESSPRSEIILKISQLAYTQILQATKTSMP